MKKITKKSTARARRVMTDLGINIPDEPKVKKCAACGCKHGFLVPKSCPNMKALANILKAVCAWEDARKRRQEQFLTAYSEISYLISKAASVANDDPLTAHQLLEQAMDREYKLLGHCDDASSLRDAILGTFEPNKYTI